MTWGNCLKTWIWNTTGQMRWTCLLLVSAWASNLILSKWQRGMNVGIQTRKEMYSLQGNQSLWTIIELVKGHWMSSFRSLSISFKQAVTMTASVDSYGFVLLTCFQEIHISSKHIAVKANTREHLKSWRRRRGFAEWYAGRVVILLSKLAYHC